MERGAEEQEREEGEMVQKTRKEKSGRNCREEGDPLRGSKTIHNPGYSLDISLQ